ncbi:RNB domain-containing ribonuclease [Streptomyces sp. NBC_01433]|uniref:RNB domain-containing ribonuclease n=1 Tax=Streptomyces sp. NBC_01433 TaxID=2903864 RepID=UPI002253134B|nr:RNB domain-containing ribonuclease [Streptomyces sp. NBC_01433]MCX4681420.1 RNB domain-containing ribonuclease [Streptomyces sp. NBC_01433]
MIDRPGSLDRDDAIEVERVGDGWRLTVYVADVAACVTPGSTADREALERRRTEYRGGWALHTMLPRPMEAQLTLAEGRPCAAIAIRMQVRPDGTVGRVDVERATVRGLVALGHSQAADAVGDRSHLLHEVVREAAAVSEVLLARRRQQGALALYDLLSGWATSEDGVVVRLASFERTIGYKIVQECMIAANTALASWAAERDLPLLFRNHSAARVAAPRQIMLDDLDLAFTDGSAARLEALRERTLMTLKAAEYAPFMGGHWGLNLPGYVHATSPLRRYPDLVVQQVISSHLDGVDSPYEDDALRAIAEALNTGARQDRDAERESRKSSAHSSARRGAAAASADYTGLDAQAFHALLKRGCKEDIAGAALVAETARRAADGQLTSLDLQLVLLVAGGSGWEPGRSACLDVIAVAPERAVSILSGHAQVNALPPVEFTVQTFGQPPNAVFFAQASWPAGESAVQGARRSAPTKKAARHQAALSLLARLADLPDPSRDLAQPVPEATLLPAAMDGAGSGESPSPISVLNEYQQTWIITGLSYSTGAEGPDHLPTFTCTAQATHDGQAVCVSATASTKAVAKTAAAASLLERVDTARAGRAG